MLYRARQIIVAFLTVFALAFAAPALALAQADEFAVMAGAVQPQAVQQQAAADTFLATYGGGAAGTEEDPYLVSTEQDLYELAKVVNGAFPQDGEWVSTGAKADPLSGKFVRLENDIELTGPAVPIGIGAHKGSANSPAMWVGFSGTFLGGGHVISNWHTTAAANPAYGDAAATYHSANCFSAPFGAVEGARIENLEVELREGMTYGAFAAGLVGYAGAGTNVIERCGVVGDVAGSVGNVGGLIGGYYGSKLTVAHCFHRGSVAGADKTIGGIVGYIGGSGLSIASSYQDGEVMTGYAGTEYYPATNAWGLVVGGGGSFTVALDACATDQAGQLYPANATRAKATGCLTGVADWRAADVQEALGADVFDFSDAATQNGAVAPPFKAVVPTYSVTFSPGSDAGDVAGELPSFDKMAQGDRLVIPDTALTRPGYDFAGWKAAYTGASESEAAVTYQAGDAFAMPAAPVTFTAQWSAWEAIAISGESELRALAWRVNAGEEDTLGKTYRLTRDIKLSCGDWVPIGCGNAPFKGTFDGAGHVVSGMRVTDSTAVSHTGQSYKAAGLFGTVSGATIENLGVEGAVAAEGTTYAGGIAAYAGGSRTALSRIRNCYAHVDVAGKGYAGGLVGCMIFSRIDDSYATGSVYVSDASGACAGGLVGATSAGYGRTFAPGEKMIDTSYAACAVTAAGEGKIAALVGRVVDTVNAGDYEGAWPQMGACYALVGSLPALYRGNSDEKAVACDVSVSAKLLLTEAELAAAWGQGGLGDAFKADSAFSAFQVNGGFPVLAWQELPTEEFEIDYVLGPGTFREGVSVAMTYAPGADAIALPAADALEELADYAFLGWYADDSFEGEPLTRLDVSEGGDRTVYANWRHRNLLLKDAAAAADAADALAAGAVVSAAGDGSDVAADEQWVSQDASDALAAAVAAVRALGAASSKDDIARAQAALDAAVAGFVPAAGTKPADGGSGDGQGAGDQDSGNGQGGNSGTGDAGAGSGSGSGENAGQGAGGGQAGKVANTLSAKGKTVKVKASKLKKKAVKLKASKAIAVAGAQGKVTFKKLSGKAKIKVAANGKVTVKKGLKKGTYKVRVRVSAAGDAAHLPASKTVTFKVKVK